MQEKGPPTAIMCEHTKGLPIVTRHIKGENKVSKHVHGYHIVTRSPWPIIAAQGAITTATGLVVYLHSSKIGVLLLGQTIIIGTISL